MKHWIFAVVCGLTAGGLAAQTPPAEPEKPPAAEGEKEPDADETAGKVDALSEAFTELKNVVDALSRLKMSGYAQAQYVHDDSSRNELSGAAATRNRDQFSVRRARIKFTYQVSKTSKLVFAPDVSSSGATLKDAWIEFTEPWTTWSHTLSAGQFNWPFGFEIGYSSSDREMPERSRVIRTLFPGERDRGVQLSGSGAGDRLKYQIAIVNGTGTVQSFDFNKRKDLVGRVGGSLGAVDLGVSVYRGAELVSVAGATSGREFEKTRHGVDFQIITPVPGLGVRGEYIRGKQPPAPGAAASAALAADVEGYYVYAIQNIGTRHQIVARYDSYDPDTGNDLPNTIANARVGTFGGAYIFHWDAHSKVVAAYESPQASGFTDPDDDVFTLRYQFKF